MIAPVRRLMRPGRLLVAAFAWALACSAYAVDWPIALNVALDPSSRSLQVEAVVQPAERDFRFVLHDSLQIAAATVDGKAVRVESTGRQGALRGWRIRLPDWCR